MVCRICNCNAHKILYQNNVFSVRKNVLRCERCKVYWLSPLPAEEELDKYYREYYSKIDYKSSYISPMVYMKLFYANMRAMSQYRFIKKHIRILPGTRVVDFGCSTGNLLKLFKKDGCATLGVELGRQSSNYASSKYGLRILRTPIEVSLYKIEAGVDLIIFSHVLEHLIDPIDILSKCFNLLKDGGHLFIELPNSYIGPPNGSQWDEFCTILLDSDHIYNFSHVNIEYLLSNCKFSTQRKIVFLSHRIAPFLRRFGLSGQVDHILKMKTTKLKRYVSILINTLYLAYLFFTQQETVERKTFENSWYGTNEWMRVLALKE